MNAAVGDSVPRADFRCARMPSCTKLPNFPHPNRRSTAEVAMTATWRLALLPLVLAAAPLTAQSEADLKRHFEGKRVTLKIAMPGTEAGVDIYPGTDRPLDYPALCRPAQGQRHGDPGRRRRDDHQDPGQVQPHRVPARRRRLRHHERRDLHHGACGVDAQEQAGEESRGRAQSGRRTRSGGGRSRRSWTTCGGPASGRTRATAPKWPTRRSRRSRTSGSGGSKAGRGSTSATATALPDAVLTPEGLEAALAEYVTFPSLPVNVAVASEPSAARGDAATSARPRRRAAGCRGRA